MAYRKRRRPTPGYAIPPPLSPITGDQATLRQYGLHPYCAMMQVAKEDTYTDYVMCRGFDPRIGKFIDYEAENADKPGIAVAKPFGARMTGYYTIGEVWPAFLPTQGSMSEGRLDTGTYVPPSPTDVDWRVGQNPGTAGGGSGGQPASLGTAIDEMKDHNGNYINWMLIGFSVPTGTPIVLWGKVDSSSQDKDGAHNTDFVIVFPCDNAAGDNPVAPETHVLLPARQHGVTHKLTADDVIAYTETEDATLVCVSDYSLNHIRFAVAQSKWQVLTTEYATVECRECDSDGETDGFIETPFPVRLMLSTSGDPAIFTGNVLGYMEGDTAGGGAFNRRIRYCVTDYMDDKIGTVKWWGKAAAVPEGWRYCGSLEDKFVVGVGDNHLFGTSGGYRQHGPAENNHADHAVQAHTTGVGTGVNFDSITAPEHTPNTSNEPEWYAIHPIERWQ